jgi:LysR family glycine cleavage system transcriptional activator
MPPLNALRAFEAAARTGSFALAATELSVTPAAVAQQVKQLEAWLGCRLFDRLARGVRLSERGRTALPALIRGFDEIGAAVRDLDRAVRPEQIEIAVLPAIATLWLAPRLAAMRRAFPKLTISITAMEAPPQLRREPYDLAIFFVSEAVTGGNVVVLREDRLTPVCSAEIAPRAHEDPFVWLRHQTLLHDSVWQADWGTWLRTAGTSDIAATEGPRFSLYSLAVQAVRDGAGVLIGHDALLAETVRRGELVTPFPLNVNPGHRLAAILPDRPAVLAQQLVTWLADAET